MSLLNLALLDSIDRGALLDHLYGDVSGCVSSVVGDVLGRPVGDAVGVGARAAEEEIRAAEVRHVDGLGSWMDGVLGSAGDYVWSSWESFKGLCGDFIDLLAGVYAAAGSLGGELAELTVLGATPVGVGGTFAPSVVPMLTQLKGSVSSLEGLLGSLRGLLGMVRFLGGQLGFLTLGVVGEWLSLAEGALSVVVAAVSAIPVK